MKLLVTTNEYNKEYNIDEIDNLKKYIIDMVKTFTKFEHIEIFQIIKKNNIKYTENSNGIFVNLNYLPINILKKIEHFINFCLKNKDCLQKEISERDKIKQLISESKYKMEEIYFDYKKNLSFDDNSNNSNLERGFSFDYECNPDNNDMYYQESTFIIPQLKK
jgi:hypothetical protein